jgi:hypothetical protein
LANKIVQLFDLLNKHLFVEKESITRPIDPPLSEIYRTTNTSRDGTTNIFLRHSHNKNPNNYAGATRLSDDEYEQEREEDDNQRDEEEGDNNQQHLKRKDNGQIHSQSSIQATMIGDHFSRDIPSSSFVDTSVRSNPNTSTILMMMKDNGGASRNGKSSYEHRTVVVSSSVRPASSGSSSSSSSLPVDEQQQQQIKARGYNFIPAPFNGTRLIAKSTEQLNRSFANDSLVKYCTPPTTPTASLFQMPTKSNSPTSILKQNYLQKYTQPSIMPSSSKIN